jgi:hypothetical protein
VKDIFLVVLNNYNFFPASHPFSCPVSINSISPTALLMYLYTLANLPILHTLCFTGTFSQPSACYFPLIFSNILTIHFSHQRSAYNAAIFLPKCTLRPIFPGMPALARRGGGLVGGEGCVCCWEPICAWPWFTNQPACCGTQ